MNCSSTSATALALADHHEVVELAGGRVGSVEQMAGDMPLAMKSETMPIVAVEAVRRLLALRLGR